MLGSATADFQSPADAEAELGKAGLGLRVSLRIDVDMKLSSGAKLVLALGEDPKPVSFVRSPNLAGVALWQVLRTSRVGLSDRSGLSRNVLRIAGRQDNLARQSNCQAAL